MIKATKYGFNLVKISPGKLDMGILKIKHRLLDDEQHNPVLAK